MNKYLDFVLRSILVLCFLGIVASVVMLIKSEHDFNETMNHFHATETQIAQNNADLDQKIAEYQIAMCKDEAGYIFKDSAGRADVEVGILDNCKYHMSLTDYQAYMSSVVAAGEHGYDLQSNDPFTVNFGGQTYLSTAQVLKDNGQPDITIFVITQDFPGVTSIRFGCDMPVTQGELVICRK